MKKVLIFIGIIVSLTLISCASFVEFSQQYDKVDIYLVENGDYVYNLNDLYSDWLPGEWLYESKTYCVSLPENVLEEEFDAEVLITDYANDATIQLDGSTVSLPSFFYNNFSDNEEKGSNVIHLLKVASDKCKISMGKLELASDGVTEYITIRTLTRKNSDIYIRETASAEKSTVEEVAPVEKPTFSEPIPAEKPKSEETTTPEPTPVPTLGTATFADYTITNLDTASLTMKAITGGTFNMGRGIYEPRRTTVSSFWIGETEVTTVQWKAVMAENEVLQARDKAGWGGDTSEIDDGDTHPINVNWNDAVLFCNELSKKEGLTPFYTVTLKNGDLWVEEVTVADWNANGYRLPTQAEWEYAAGGGATNRTTYAGTNNDKITDENPLRDYAWYASNANGTTHPVKEKLPNTLDLYDMSGNLREWCWDWQCYEWGDYVRGAGDITFDTWGKIIDRMVRGGGFDEDSSACQVGKLNSADTDMSAGAGFRLVRNAEEPNAVALATTTSTSKPKPATTPKSEPKPTSGTATFPDYTTTNLGTKNFTMKHITGGTFIMDEWRKDWADGGIGGANRITTISNFYLGETEITQAQWKTVMGNDIPDNPYQNHTEFNYGAGDTHPMYYVSWDDAIAFCNALSIKEGLTPFYTLKERRGWGPEVTVADWNANGYRLPTDAEWEYAAGHGGFENDGTTQKARLAYAGTNIEEDVHAYAWYNEWGEYDNHEVKTKWASPLGLYDMNGNVTEWCWDGDYALWWGAVTNPTGPDGSNYHIIRDSAEKRELPGNSSDCNSSIGFRVARNVVSTPKPTPKHTPTPTPSRFADYTTKGFDTANFTMKAIAGGTFSMGQPDPNLGSYYAPSFYEQPVRQVTVDSFYMGETEVTQALWLDIMGTVPYGEYGRGDNYPMYWVDWYYAVKFCNALSIKEGLEPVYYTGDTYPTVPNITRDGYLSIEDEVKADWTKNGYRLPTEAEWEYAAGGGATNRTTYAGTSKESYLSTYAWSTPTSGRNAGSAKNYPVKGKKSNTLGLYDMSGNVAEWCWDHHSESYDARKTNNPTGLEEGDTRVYRGGDVNAPVSACRVAYRGVTYPDECGNSVGLRLVRNAK